jgi:hypothetical protein
MIDMEENIIDEIKKDDEMNRLLNQDLMQV